MKWSDIVYIAIIAGLAIFAFRDCGKGGDTETVELKCPDYDSLIAVVDSLIQLPPDTVIRTRVTTKTLIKTVVSTDTLEINPPIVNYVTVNDSNSRAFVVDTLTIRGELLSHKQWITFLDEEFVIYEPVPELVFVHDTITLAKQVFSYIPEKWSVSAGGSGGYIFGKPYIAPAVEVKINRWSFSAAKPFDDASSFILQTSYRLFGK